MANDEKKNLTIRINGVRVVFPDQQPEIDSGVGRTLIPLRGGFDAIGFDVDWIDKEKTAIIKNSKYRLKFKVGVKSYSITNLTNSTELNPKDLDAAPKINDRGRIMIPLRGPLEEVDCNIDYVPDEKIAHITYREAIKLSVETNLELRKSKNYDGRTPDTSSDGVIETLAKGTVLTTFAPLNTYDELENIPYIKVKHGDKIGWVAIRQRDTKEEYLVVRASGGGQAGGSGSGSITYLSDKYMQWLTIAEGYIPYPYRDIEDNADMQKAKNVTMGIGFTFDNTKRNWDILSNVLGWTDEEILSIVNGVYDGKDYSSSKYVISKDQVYSVFNKVAEKTYMPDLNTSIRTYNNQNGSAKTYSQRELEAMFDFSYNNGLSPSKDTGYTYSASINNTDQIIYYYLRKDLKGGVSAVKRFGNGSRRRLNQMNLFFKDYDFLDKSGSGLDPLREKLGF